jgi:hypothetical protein
MTEFKRETVWFDTQCCTFRSGWEQNYAYYLEWLKKQGEIKDWEYEPQRYYFIDYKVKPPKPLGNGYLPDFKVINNDGSWYLVEIKGRRQGINKLKRMKRFYPEIKVELIEAKEYNELKRKIGKICNFE